MNTINLQCSQLETAAYLTQALRVSLPHNPDAAFTITCDEKWHRDLKEFCDDARLQFSTEVASGACDVDIGLNKLKREQHNNSIPRMFLNNFRVIAGHWNFVSGLNDERDLIFQSTHRYVGSPSRILFINEMNPWLTNDQMDTLIQSVIDRRYSVVTTSPTQVRHPVWTENRTLGDYAFLASQADFVIGCAGAHMAVSFNQQSINKVRGWIVIDPKFSYPFNERSYHAQTWQAAIQMMRQNDLC